MAGLDPAWDWNTEGCVPKSGRSIQIVDGPTGFRALVGIPVGGLRSGLGGGQCKIHSSCRGRALNTSPIVGRGGAWDVTGFSLRRAVVLREEEKACLVIAGLLLWDLLDIIVITKEASAILRPVRNVVSSLCLAPPMNNACAIEIAWKVGKAGWN